PASDRGVQTESVDDPDAAVHRLRLAGIHAQRRDGPTPAASFHSADLSLDLARAPDLLLDLSQHAVVSVRVMTKALIQNRVRQRADAGIHLKGTKGPLDIL